MPGGTGSGLNNRIQFVRGLERGARVDAWLTRQASGAGGHDLAWHGVGFDSTSAAGTGFKS